MAKKLLLTASILAASILVLVALLAFLRPLETPTSETCSDHLEPPLVSSVVGIPILMYHELGDAPNELYVSPGQFIAQMDYLVEHGYTTISFEDLLAHWADGAPLPKNPVLITFDDGYSSAYSVAFEVLAERGLTATFFITTGMVGEPNHVTWPQLVEMSLAGFTIASHSVSHAYLATCDAAALQKELGLSKQVLEENLSIDVVALSYPFGQFNEDVVRTACECGYQVAVTTRVGLAFKGQDIMALPRLPVYRSLDMAGFERVLQGVLDGPE
jgi:peptidoglycan/xylan/chitin deacetylase (PgdA/CDA1 family)